MKTKLLALDLDGTLINSEGGISELTRRAIRKVTDLQIKVVICTGRRYRTAIKDVLPLGLQCPLIVHNGVLIKEIGTGRTLCSNFMRPDIYQEVIVFMKETLQFPLVYVDNFHDGIDFITSELDQSHPFQIEYVMDNFQYCAIHQGINHNNEPNVIMVSLMADMDSLEKLAGKAVERFSDRLTVHVLRNVKYKGCILELFSPGTSKWHSLRQLADSFGIAGEEIMAIGDDVNDLEMLRNSGLGIAMGNACEEVKNVASYVTSDNNHEGVLQAIEKFLI